MNNNNNNTNITPSFDIDQELTYNNFPGYTKMHTLYQQALEERYMVALTDRTLKYKDIPPEQRTLNLSLIAVDIDPDNLSLVPTPYHHQCQIAVIKNNK